MTEYALTRIEAESTRMTTLVGDLLLLSRLDEGRDLQVEDVDWAIWWPTRSTTPRHLARPPLRHRPARG